MSKNNIGKWKYDKDEGDWLVMDDRFSIIAIVQEESDIDPEKAARLIASAPDLLEALIAANAELEMWRAGFPNHSDSEEVAVMIDEAIAKATGESA